MEQETLIELTEDDLNQIVGGKGHASLCRRPSATR
jgi:bacteriocin-like protein